MYRLINRWSHSTPLTSPILLVFDDRLALASSMGLNSFLPRTGGAIPAIDLEKEQHRFTAAESISFAGSNHALPLVLENNKTNNWA